MENENKYYTQQEIAAIFGVTVAAISNWIKRKQMPKPDIQQHRFTRWQKSTIQPFIDDPVGWRQKNS